MVIAGFAQAAEGIFSARLDRRRCVHNASAEARHRLIASVPRSIDSRCCSAPNGRAPRPRSGRGAAHNGRVARSSRAGPAPMAGLPIDRGARRGRAFRAAAAAADWARNSRTEYLSYCRSSGYRDRERTPPATAATATPRTAVDALMIGFMMGLSSSPYNCRRGGTFAFIRCGFWGKEERGDR